LDLACGLRGTSSSFAFGDIGKYMKRNNNYKSWLAIFYMVHGAFDENEGWHKEYEQSLMNIRGWEYEINSSSVSKDDSIAPTGCVAKIISYIKSALVKNLNDNLRRNTGIHYCRVYDDANYGFKFCSCHSTLSLKTMNFCQL